MPSNEPTSVEIKLSSEAALNFLQAHMHMHYAEHLCRHAFSGDHDDDPAIWQEPARREIADADAAIHDFTRAVRANGISLVIGTFGAAMRELSQRLDAVRFRATADMADHFVWSEPLFDDDSPFVRHLNAAPARES